MSETDNVKQPNAPAEDATATPTPASEASPTAEPTAASEANSSPEAALAAARQEAAAAQDRYLRSLADLENIRRRHMREKEELRAFAAARVVEELLPVLDNLGLGLTAAKAPNADLSTLVGGIEMVATQLKAALGNHGLKEINPVGQAFDPNLHEAISQQPSADVPEEHVVQVVRTGYTLNGRLLRPASVVVSGGAVEEAKR
ncbi:MAG TPA: nucleotide exchange factor GrpE [Candidatus Synoicihabitans sp.]|nr:nucleotide exchange factor GrpE [Candidatus Synoicihabitans sp.]